MRELLFLFVLSLAGALAAMPQSSAGDGSPRSADGSADQLSTDELVARGDRAFERRAEGAEDVAARPETIGVAVEAFRQALERRPSSIEIRVKLLRALLFQAEYATTEEDVKKQRFELGRTLFEEGLTQLEERFGKHLDKLDTDELQKRLAAVPEAGPLFFWGAVHWGLWGEYFGKFASVRKGVAGKIRRYGEAALALAPEYSDAGPYRLLGRLHALSPVVPFFTGWIDRDRAIELLGKAVELAPDDPLNRFFLGEALLEYRPAERDKALSLIRSAAHATPRPGRELEDTEAIHDAAERLQELEG